MTRFYDQPVEMLPVPACHSLAREPPHTPTAAFLPDAAKQLIAQTRELLQPLRLIGAEVVSERVQLNQVAQLDAQGKELAHGAGQATVKLQLGVGRVPVRGAGAKTLAFAVPDTGQARFSGIFHAWRTLGKATHVKLGTLEEALGVGVLADPELDQYHGAGHQIQITRLEFVYLALPAFMRQTHLVPAFQVEGMLAAPRAYAAADLFGPY